MRYRVRTETRPTGGGLDGTVFLLEDDVGGERAEVWPAFGFNCYRWQVSWDGQPTEVLYADPQLFNNSKPTRSGIPILFPFPNRIRDGRFRWEDKDYRLPLNDTTGKNAIHGFACWRPWRVVDQGASDQEAWLTGEFQGSADAPDTQSLWPADYKIRLTYRLAAGRLRLEALVENPNRRPLPFGLGYHPYFRVPPVPGDKEAECWIQAGARSLWELQESLPTGTRQSVDAARDLNTPRRFQELQLDDVLTDLVNLHPGQADGLCLRGTLKKLDGAGALQLWTSPAFRELVAFTPPHRQAVCLEPYTCTTDAVNLQQRGVDAGLLVLQPREKWSGVVQMLVG